MNYVAIMIYSLNGIEGGLLIYKKTILMQKLLSSGDLTLGEMRVLLESRGKGSNNLSDWENWFLEGISNNFWFCTQGCV